jgi:hypothetical protein
MVMSTIVSVDLRDRAERSENFPEEWSKEKIESSIERYEKFLRLASKYPLESIAPTSDIDEIWHLHMLSPVSYYNDCMKLMGKILDHDGGFGAKLEELPELESTFMKTSKLWEKEYGSSYVDVPKSQLDDGLKKCWHNCQSRCHNACKS